ncbi:MAG: ribosomal protection-like ABC-F family protein [Deltaproteobacteria bacterium]
MIEIEVKNLEKYHGSNHVLKGVSFEVQKAERVAFVGRNGCGKTTLFNILSGTEKQDAGELFITKNSTLGMVEQIPDFQADNTVRQIMNSAFKEVNIVKEKMSEIEDAMRICPPTEELLKRYGDLQETYQLQGGYEIDEKISRACIGLKISDEVINENFSNLSGGEQTRVMLARAVLQAPDILLLDEPTNHLDVSSIEWLEVFLKEYHGTILIISHDRFFLDRVVGKIIEIEDGKATTFNGNYTSYQKEKAEIIKNQQSEYQLHRQNIRKLEAEVKRLHAWGNRADEIAYHHTAWKLQTVVKEMKKQPKPGDNKTINSQFLKSDFSSQDVVIFENAAKRFDDKEIFKNVNIIIRKGECAAVVGDNGAGKSTLIKALIGEIKLDEGSTRFGESVAAAYLPQVIAFENPCWSLLETVKQELKISEVDAMPLLVKYGFPKQDWHKSVSNISGGERIRLKICILMQQKVNLLLLDEPTNHLDIQSREWLENAIQNFGGTLVFVSHDRYFINKFATRILELENGEVNDYACDYNNYREIKSREVKKALTKTKLQPNVNMKAEKKVREDRLDDRSQSEIEKEIYSIERELQIIEQKMLKEQNHSENLLESYNEYEEMKKQADLLYERWYKSID